MSITTLDGIIAGVQPPRFFSKNSSSTIAAGRPFSLWGVAGMPGAGSYDTTLNGVTLTAPVNGQIPFSNPGSGNSYLARFVGHMNSAGSLLLCDRLWHNGGYTISSTSAQNSTTPTWPARDNSGSTNGDGVLIGLEVSATVGAGTPTLTVSYTNSSGTSGHSGTNINSTVASTQAGNFYPIGLQTGDIGVRSVQSLTLSATWTSGTINLVAYRILAMLDINAGTAANAIDSVSSGFPQIYNSTVPFILAYPSASSPLISGSMLVTQG